MNIYQKTIGDFSSGVYRISNGGLGGVTCILDFTKATFLGISKLCSHHGEGVLPEAVPHVFENISKECALASGTCKFLVSFKHFATSQSQSKFSKKMTNTSFRMSGLACRYFEGIKVVCTTALDLLKSSSWLHKLEVFDLSKLGNISKVFPLLIVASAVSSIAIFFFSDPGSGGHSYLGLAKSICALAVVSFSAYELFALSLGADCFACSISLVQWFKNHPA